VVRQRLFDRLVDAGRVEIYDAPEALGRKG
jgi:hypothetical protein